MNCIDKPRFDRQCICATLLLTCFLGVAMTGCESGLDQRRQATIEALTDGYSRISEREVLNPTSLEPAIRRLETATAASLAEPYLFVAAAVPSTKKGEIYMAIHWVADQPLADKVRLRWDQHSQEAVIPIEPYWIDRNKEASAKSMLYDATIYYPPLLVSGKPLPADLEMILLKGSEEISNSILIDASRVPATATQ